MLRLDESADGREIELSVGQEMELTLGENPTTGYRWKLISAGEPACALVNDAYHPPAEGRPGQGGSRVWLFRAARAGRSLMEVVYGPRVSRSDGPPARTFTLRVRVGE